MHCNRSRSAAVLWAVELESSPIRTASQCTRVPDACSCATAAMIASCSFSRARRRAVAQQFGLGLTVARQTNWMRRSDIDRRVELLAMMRASFTSQILEKEGSLLGSGVHLRRILLLLLLPQPPQQQQQEEEEEE